MAGFQLGFVKIYTTIRGKKEKEKKSNLKSSSSTASKITISNSITQRLWLEKGAVIMNWTLVSDETIRKQQSKAANIIRTDFQGHLVDITKANVYHLNFVNKTVYFDELDAYEFLEYLKCQAGGDCFDVMECLHVPIKHLEKIMQAKEFNANDPLHFLLLLGARKTEVDYDSFR